ncbi:MAG TPA: hypothetical protein PLJ60_12225 [Chryseolinea sp.]|nr:hypothetical protein [Chryseolinea sp.]
MKKLALSLLVLVGTCLAILSSAQESKKRLQAGRLYKAGEALHAPRLGFISKVPEGWQGVLPRETEVFMLTTTSTSVYGEIYMFGTEKNDIQSMREAWVKGFDLTDNIKLKATNPTVTDDILMGEVVLAGDKVNGGNRGFAVARCNPSGPCVTVLAIMPKQFYDEISKSALEALKLSSFEPPSNVSPYANFDWKEFLSDKDFFAYAYVEGASKDNRVQLCRDGSFTANITKKGWMKDQHPEYNGRLSGQWTVDGVGEQTTLHLTFTKKKGLEPLDFVLNIEDEKIFVNGERYFTGASTKCK